MVSSEDNRKGKSYTAGCTEPFGKLPRAAHENRRRTGSRYEQLAAASLVRMGFEILEQNYRCRAGEIDLIAREQRYLVFIEVKYRSSGQSGDPAEAVDRKKQRRIIKTARYYLMTHGYSEDTPCRFDVAAILGEEVRLIRDAFWMEE